MNGYVATATVVISAPAPAVWHALTDPETVKQFMFGSDVETDWKEGSSIVYSGIWEGKKFEDKGKIVKVVPNKLLVTTHYSPLSGVEDVPENYHTITYELTEADGKTTLKLSQDNNADETARAESEKNWQMVVDGIKKVVEGLV